MNNSYAQLLLFGLIVGALSGCQIVESDVGTVNLSISTDSTTYELQRTPGIYSVSLTVDITNEGHSTVFLHRACGYGDQPGYTLTRVKGDERIWLGNLICITKPLRQPIPLEPGETYTHLLEMESTVSPNAVPPKTMDMRTGEFLLEYHVQRTDRVEGWAPVDLADEPKRWSNTFTVLPPSDP